MNPSGKVADILLTYHAVLNDFRVAGNRHQRGFQLMGHIGGKFPADFFRFLLLRHIQNQNYSSGNCFRHPDRISQKLIVPVSQFQKLLAFLSGQSLLQSLLQHLIAVDGNDIVIDALFLSYPEQSLRGPVNSQHCRPVGDDQPVLHVFRNRHVFFLILLQLFHLILNLPVLPADPPQQRTDLLVGISVFRRMLQIQLVDGFYNAVRHPSRENQGDNHQSRDESRGDSQT